MAKQSGLHQIRGKVGEHSYYRQTGVSNGLIRSINQGLSSRVKTSDEYANTRLNNAEFGAACNVAGILGRMVVPKYRPMVLPFSQSIMAKKVLELAKANSGLWGERVVAAADTPELAQILTDTSKLKMADFMSCEVSRTSEAAVNVDLEIPASQVSTLLSLGIDGFNFKGSLYNVRTGQYSQSTGKILRGTLRLGSTGTNDDNLVFDDSISSSITLSVGAFPTVTGFTNHRFVVVIFEPFCTVGNVNYTLQEYCMFAAFQLPDYNG